MKLLILSCFLVLKCVSALHGADIHVAPGGSDDNPGTVQQPLGTLEKARDLVRENLKTSDSGDITVFLADGTYRISDTLIFGHEDAASDGRRVTWRN